jgi:amyloid beta precursor protein binding protein 1
MKSDTDSYVRLQNLYRAQAAEEREQFRALLRVPVESELVDLFVKNAHGVQLLKGACYGALDAAPEKLSESNTLRFLSVGSYRDNLVDHLGGQTREAATHLAFSALDAWRSSPPRQTGGPTESELREHVTALIPGAELGEKEISDAVGEMYFFLLSPGGNVLTRIAEPVHQLLISQMLLHSWGV